MACDIISRLQYDTHELCHVEGVVGKLWMVPKGWMVTLGETRGRYRSNTQHREAQRDMGAGLVMLVRDSPLPCPVGTLCSFAAKSHIEHPAVEPNLDSSSHPDSYIWEGQMHTLYRTMHITVLALRPKMQQQDIFLSSAQPSSAAPPREARYDKCLLN